MEHFVYCVLPEWVFLTLRPTTFSVCEVAQILWHHSVFESLLMVLLLPKDSNLLLPRLPSSPCLLGLCLPGPLCILSFSPSSPFFRVPPQPQFSRHLCLGTVFFTKLIHPHGKLRRPDTHIYKYFLLLSHAIRNFKWILFFLDSSYLFCCICRVHLQQLAWSPSY